MNRFARWVVKHRVVVVVICLALMIPSIFGMASTRVKYDLLYYLPEELDTIKGQNILMEDFGKGAFFALYHRGIKRSRSSRSGRIHSRDPACRYGRRLRFCAERLHSLRNSAGQYPRTL